eukprot:522669_1
MSLRDCQQEKRFGPHGIWTDSDKTGEETNVSTRDTGDGMSSDSEQSGDDFGRKDDQEDDGTGYYQKKLWRHERDTMRYYYHDIAYDSVEMANVLYSASDGIEFEYSSKELDMRFISAERVFLQRNRVTLSQTSRTDTRRLMTSTVRWRSEPPGLGRHVRHHVLSALPGPNQLRPPKTGRQLDSVPAPPALYGWVHATHFARISAVFSIAFGSMELNRTCASPNTRERDHALKDGEVSCSMREVERKKGERMSGKLFILLMPVRVTLEYFVLSEVLDWLDNYGVNYEPVFNMLLKKNNYVSVKKKKK